MSTSTIDRPARELVRQVLGPAADELSDKACGRLLGVLYVAGVRELEQNHRYDHQLELDAA